MQLSAATSRIFALKSHCWVRSCGRKIRTRDFQLNWYVDRSVVSAHTKKICSKVILYLCDSCWNAKRFKMARCSTQGQNWAIKGESFSWTPTHAHDERKHSLPVCRNYLFTIHDRSCGITDNLSGEGSATILFPLIVFAVRSIDGEQNC